MSYAFTNGNYPVNYFGYLSHTLKVSVI